MTRMRQDQAHGPGAPSRAHRDQRVSGTWAGWRIWVLLAGAIFPALAGGLAGLTIGMDDLASSRMSGPRLKVSPSAKVTSTSLSRDGRFSGVEAC